MSLANATAPAQNAGCESAIQACSPSDANTDAPCRAPAHWPASDTTGTPIHSGSSTLKPPLPGKLSSTMSTRRNHSR